MTDSHALPERIGRYDIKRLLGSGAMGSVYLAEDPRIKRKLAIKVVKMEAQKSEQDRRELLVRFEREAEISGLLNDPGIVTIYDVGDSDLGPFLAMEFVQGESLDARIKRGEVRHMPMAARLQILAGIAAALDHAHAHGIVHRDVKPANVMLTEAGRPKLMDFGIAKREDAGLTQTGTFLGTPNYASPEQIRDGDSSPKSDLFSLGVLAFELLSGVLPFQGNSINTILYRIVNEPPVEVHPPVLGLVPEAWRRIFLKVLAKDPAVRHENCSAFVRELMDASVDATEAERADILALLPLSTPLETLALKTTHQMEDPHATRRTVKTPTRKPLWMILAATAVAAAVALVWLLPRRTPHIMLRSQPQGAKVLVEGKVMGETPLGLVLKPGTHVTLEQAGHHAETRTVAEGMRDLEIALKPRLSEEWLVTEPKGATVVMDGQTLKGSTPLSVSWNQGAPHRLTFTLAGREGEQVLAQDYKPGEVPGGAVHRLKSASENAPPDTPGTLRLAASYGVHLRVDGKDLGEVHAGGSLTLSSGAHRVEVSNPKVFLHRAFQTQLPPGGTRTLALPELAQLTVSTHPSSGTVVVDGQSTGVESDGNTPIALVSGSHVIAIQGAPATQRTVEVTGHKTLKFQY